MCNFDADRNVIRNEVVTNWLRILATAMTLLLTTTACGLLQRVREFAGADTRRKPQVCVVVAPDLLPPEELDRTLTLIINDVRAEHGTIDGYVAVGPSASAFPSLSFSADANGGVLASTAGSDGARDDDAVSWAAQLLGELHLQLSVTLPGDDKINGLDLLGGIGQCARKLGDATRDPTIVVVSHGVHRTDELDLVAEASRALELLPLEIAALVPAPIQLRLYQLGRIDPSANGGPAARAVIEPVVDGWVAACTQLDDRCAIERKSS